MPIALGTHAQRSAAPRQASLPDETILATAWERWHEGRCVEARNQLVNHYMRSLVRPIAIRVHGGLPPVVDVDDLIQQGYLGLIDAMGRFCQDRNTRFQTFARPRVFGAIQDYLRSIDHVPRLTRIRSKRVQAAQERFSKQNGRPATFEDLDRLIDMPDPNDIGFHRFLSDHRPAAMISFSSVTTDRGGEESSDADAMDCFEELSDISPVDQAARDDLRELIVRGFDRRDRLIVILYYYEQMTMREVGASLGISESRVSQRLDSILQCLRARLGRGELEQEFRFA